MTTKTLLLISGNIYGRPMGGVTMHVHRLLKRLIEPKVANYQLCDYKRESIIEQLTKIKKADWMHVHASNPYLKLFYVISGKLLGTKSLITLHGKYGMYGKWKNYIHKFALKWCDVPILINHESYEAVSSFNNEAIFVSAFIPPIEEEEVISSEFEDCIMNIKADGKLLFVTNASSRAFTDDGKEIYGIDFLIAFFSEHTMYNLVVLDPNNEYAPLYKNNRFQNVWIFTGKQSFCGLVKMADVVIRNTPTDGDSFSVKEALCLHKPILATDAVSRPDGVFLFKYNDKISLERSIFKALSHNKEIILNEKDATDLYEVLYRHLGLI